MSNNSLVRLGAALLLIALCLQVLAGIITTSPTFDEPYHIVRSYVYLKTGDRALLARGGHPPWANMISVAPLLLRSDIALPPHQPGWPEVPDFKGLFWLADEFLWRLGNDAESIVSWARLPGVLLSALLAGLVFLWARQLHARCVGHLAATSAALLALLLYAFDPNLIAHTAVVTTDLGATLFIFWAVYCLWRFCRQPSWSRLLLTGLVFGFAQATKFSSLFLAPIFVVLLALWVLDKDTDDMLFALPGENWLAGRRAWQRIYRLLGLSVVVFSLGLLVVWAIHGFEVGRLLPHEDTHPLLDRLLHLRNPGVKRMVYSLAENLPVPAPSYFAALAWLQRYTAAGHPSFLMGNYGTQGWWYYFPVAFVIKTPVPMLLLLLAAAYLTLRHRQKWRDEAFLLVPAGLFLVSGMLSPIDIGYRNILPVLPFAFVYVSKVGLLAVGRLQRVLLVLLCSWYML
ncbi:MAG: glycosyltransferase family 39 protein, partial [Chloroflexi bacterium]|nr:glycosyltransferase family 39 protein [Chloroflexota bacterium]